MVIFPNIKILLKAKALVKLIILKPFNLFFKKSLIKLIKEWTNLTDVRFYKDRNTQAASNTYLSPQLMSNHHYYNPYYKQNYQNHYNSHQYNHQNWSFDHDTRSHYQNQSENGYYQNAYYQADYSQYQNYAGQKYQNGNYYQQGYQNYNQAYQYDQNYYYQPYRQQYTNQRQYQNYYPKHDSFNQNQYYASQPSLQQYHASQTQFQANEPKKEQINLSAHPNQKSKNTSNQQKIIDYQPGQSSNADCRQIRKEVGHANWLNPYKETNTKLDQSKVYQYRNQHHLKHRNKQRQATRLNNSFAEAFSNHPQRDPFINVSFSTYPQAQRDGSYHYNGERKKKKQNNNNRPSNAANQMLKQKEKSYAQIVNEMGYFPEKQDVIQGVSCPFDPSHIIQPSRLLTHISRCKLKCETAQLFKVCPYDPTHYFMYDLIEAHKAECDKKHLFVIESPWQQLLNNTQVQQSTRSNICDLSKSKYLEEVSVSENDKSQQLMTETHQNMSLQKLLTADF